MYSRSCSTKKSRSQSMTHPISKQESTLKLFTSKTKSLINKSKSLTELLLESNKNKALLKSDNSTEKVYQN